MSSYSMTDTGRENLAGLGICRSGTCNHDVSPDVQVLYCFVHTVRKTVKRRASETECVVIDVVDMILASCRPQ